MYVIIVGCGRTGSKLAKKLTRNNHDVAIVDRYVENFSNLHDSFDGKTILGVEFDKDILISAGINQADMIISVSKDDSTNIMVSQFAKIVFNVKHIVLRINNPSLAKLYANSDFKVICPASLVSDEISSFVSKREKEN